MAKDFSVTSFRRRLASNEQGVIGYAFLWMLGVPAGILFLVFLLRGCN